MNRIMLRDFKQPSQKPTRRTPWAWIFLTLGLTVGILIYSGAAWMWFRPVVHKTLINKYAGIYKFDPLWVMAIIKVESGFQSDAKSHRGAVGLMQLLPTTAQEIGPEIGLPGLTEQDLLNPDINLNVGVYYLTKLHAMFPEDDMAVLSSYNAGPGITQQWRKGKPVLDISDIDYLETRRFVRRVEKTYGALKILQGWKHLFGISHDR